MNRVIGNDVAEKLSATSKTFVEDTAEKLGVTPRTVSAQIQMAKNLTPAAKEIIQSAGSKITKQSALKLSRLPPDLQEEAARQLLASIAHAAVNHQLSPAQSTPEETTNAEHEPAFSPPPDAPYSLGEKAYTTFEESVADLKNYDKDCSYTPDTLLADMDGFIERFHQDFAWYSNPLCTVVFPHISKVQFDYIKKRFSTISSAMEDLLHQLYAELDRGKKRLTLPQSINATIEAGSDTEIMEIKRLVEDSGFVWALTKHTGEPFEIEAMQNVDIRSVDPDTLRDIRNVKVNTDLPKKERILDFIRQIGNPYCYRHGKYVVKVSFTDTDVTLEDRMLSYLRSKC